MNKSKLTNTWVHRLIQVIFTISILIFISSTIFVFLESFPKKRLNLEDSLIRCEYGDGNSISLKDFGVKDGLIHLSKYNQFVSSSKDLDARKFCGYEKPKVVSGYDENFSLEYLKRKSSYIVYPVYGFTFDYITHLLLMILSVIFQLFILGIFRFIYYYVLTGEKVWLKIPNKYEEK